MGAFLTWISERAKERSTWLGLVAFLSAVGISISPDLSAAIATLGVAIGGLVGVLTADKKAE